MPANKCYGSPTQNVKKVAVHVSDFKKQTNKHNNKHVSNFKKQKKHNNNKWTNKQNCKTQ